MISKNLIRKNMICLQNFCMTRKFSTASVNIDSVSSSSDISIEEDTIKKTRHNKVTSKHPLLNIHKAIDLVKQLSWAKFDETVEISLNLGLDPRKPNQAVKGMASLPYGIGKVVRVCVFATGSSVNEAKDAGADLVGGEELVAMIQAGIINFDTVIATPETMPFVGKLGKILGPRGLMPNPKLGTVTKDVAKAVINAKAGAVKFKVEKRGIMQAGIGKVSFTNEALLGNIRAFMLAVIDAKPEGLKGKYLKVAHISSSMGPGIEVDITSLDPGNARFMLDMSTIRANK